MRKGDLVFAVNSSNSNETLSNKLVQMFGVSTLHPKAVQVAIATGARGEVCEATEVGMVRRQLVPGFYRFYSYRGAMYDEVRRVAVLLAQAFSFNWIDDADFAEDDRRMAILSVFRDTVARNDDYDPSIGHSVSRTGGEASARRSALPARGHISAALISRCYLGAFEALSLNLSCMRRGATVSVCDFERSLIRDPRWHARNKGRAVEIS